MNTKEKQKEISNDPRAASKPGKPEGTMQAKMPPFKTWLWFMAIMLANMELR
jgi:hypothetical protein